MDHLVFFSANDNNDYNNNNNNNADDNMHNILLLYPDAVCLNWLTYLAIYNRDPRIKTTISVPPQSKAGHALEEKAVQNA